MSKVYSCYCNNGDYHQMPDLNFEVIDRKFQYDMAASQYMFLPYINYTQPMSLCLLGLSELTEYVGDSEIVAFGQRALSSFPFQAHFDVEGGKVSMAMAGSVDVNSSSSLGFQIAVSITIVVVLFVMLVYLIYLRRNRIKAEEWLEENKHILFSGAKNLKTEEEILEALVKSKEM